MAIHKQISWARSMSLCLTLVLGVVAAVRAGGSEGTSPDNAYLDGLDGRWIMAGTLRGTPVRYQASGQRVLQGGFLRLHMIDDDQTARYEADLYVGFDSHSNDFVAHWLDKFGAAGARVVATGKRDDQRLVLIFPYGDGAFRDTFAFDPKSGTWTLLIESQESNGAWSTFATYTLVRPVHGNVG